MAVKERGQTIPEEAARELVWLAELLERDDPTDSDVDQACRFLASMYGAGWSCGAMGRAMGWGRNRVWYWATRYPPGCEPYQHMPEIPEPPEKPEFPRRKRGIDIDENVKTTMRQLYRKARLTRGGHAEGHPYRVASEELTRIMSEQTDLGATYRQIAEILGIKVKTVRERLARHGYRRAYPALTTYRGGVKQQKESGS